MKRRDVLTLAALGAAGGIGSILYRHYRLAAGIPSYTPRDSAGQFPVQFVNVAAETGLAFQHNSGAFGKKYLPETLGSGCAFLDYDNDGWLDVLLINGMDWPEHYRRRTTM